MAQAANRVFARNEFLTRAKNGIVDASWTRLLTQDQNLLNQLNAILETLHAEYEPQEDGSWKAAPKWTNMFQWTSCPLESVRAVVLLNEPLDKNLFTFESTGYALGCQPKNAAQGYDLSRNKAVVNFLKIVCQATRIPWDENQMRDRFRNGFDPSALSRRGILFFNLGLTKGNGAMRDVDRWKPFSEEVLRIVGRRASGDVPVLQLYRNNDLDRLLEEEEKRGQRLVLVKPRPWPGRANHVAYFTDEDAASHGAAWRRSTYEALDAVLQRLEDGEGEAKRVIVEMHRLVDVNDGGRLNLSGTDRLVAVSHLQLEHVRLQRRMEPMLWMEQWLHPEN